MSGGEQDVIDRIDALVDEQLEQEASGYDHNLNQPRCRWCGEEWHGLATERQVCNCGCERAFGVACPGSTVEGPLPLPPEPTWFRPGAGVAYWFDEVRSWQSFGYLDSIEMPTALPDLPVRWVMAMPALDAVQVTLSIEAAGEEFRRMLLGFPVARFRGRGVQLAAQRRIASQQRMVARRAERRRRRAQSRRDRAGGAA